MKLTDIRGIGPKTEQLFNRLGIFTVEDLIRYYPVSYDEYKDPVPIGSVIPGVKNSVEGTVREQVVARRTGKYHITTTVISDESGRIRLTWFNAPFIPGLLKKGSVYIFRGTVHEKNGMLVMDHPEIHTLSRYDGLKKTLVPVYGLTKGLSGKTVAKAVKEVLEQNPPEISEYLPESLIRLHGLMDETEAVRTIHFPDSEDCCKAARDRLAFDEFFLFILALRTLKMSSEEMTTHYPMKAAWETEEMMEQLPYRMTSAQIRCWREIERDMTGGGIMSRLLQGDVGSGKTIIAFLAAALSASCGYQTAIMAPTEVLARQHYEKLMHLKTTLKLSFLNPVLLVGSLKAAERRAVLGLTGSGEANVVIGTHALLEPSVQYRNLALLVTDEQHRFGVRQRNALLERGEVPHTLVMSATPIPRTLGVIFYGDLDISVLDERPLKRLPVKTAVVDEGYRGKAYQFIGKQIHEGRQAYIICPMIEPSEDFDSFNVFDETEAVKKALQGVRTEMLHGRMKAEEKNAVMERFLRGETDILVSTTVIEVGVDVANASVIMIMGAERFGLAQLHQLRGRVGRGSFQSYCILLEGQKNDTTEKRLSVLKEYNDGFRIAEKDFELRGPGDLLGVRQSGDALFRIADVTRDSRILAVAGETAAAVLRDDPALIDEAHELLKAQLNRYMMSNERKITL